MEGILVKIIDSILKFKITLKHSAGKMSHYVPYNIDRNKMKVL